MQTVAPATPKSWYLPSKPHKFCPGCGHGIVLKALGEVIDELEIQDKTIFGCDIGCSLLSWDFFACDSTQKDYFEKHCSDIEYMFVPLEKPASSASSGTNIYSMSE